MDKLLRLNLQHFAEETPEEQTPAEAQPTDNQPEETKQPDNKIPYDRFKAKVDEANELKRKLEEFEKQRDDAERQRLEEQNNYKELFQQAEQKLAQYQADALDAKKDAMLAKAGYSEDQISKFRKYLDGDTDESLSASLEELKTDIPPKKEYVDPSASNGKREKPETTDLKEAGKSLYQRLRETGSIRR